MKLKILRAIYFGNKVVVEGEEIETLEQHGRELVLKGYAVEIEGEQKLVEPEPKKETKGKKEK
ncbi:hypothetical protein DYB39_07040 [Providencia rettgeri]|uniref:DUF7210 family protein n=1 Tax=Providencia rettgeri TaxID=587 RepID=UPI000E3D94E6|nr:hypothetical protein [Providencia rettgeri]RFT10734.1 hypothetical protein DYB39_07040 [Providencia rettgeri]